jgi:hypothetical protein
LALFLAFGLVGTGRAEDQAKAIVDKAIKAMGGEAKISKAKATTFKGKGNYYGMGNAIPYTAEFAVQLPTKFKNAIEADVGGQKFMMTVVVNGDKGWIKTNDNVEEMPAERLAEQKEEMYADWVTSLVPLQESGYTLAPLGDSKVDNKEAVGVKVSSKGHRDVSLFFDKNTGLLLKNEHKIKDEMSGQEMTQTSTFSGYKEVDGVQEAMKIVIKRDGNIYIEVENSDLKHHDNLDEKMFVKP